LSYKITIPKKGDNIGGVIIESLDTTSCSVVQEVSQYYGPIKSMTPINHGDDQPVYDSVHVTE
jgi:hypothetical protein